MTTLRKRKGRYGPQLTPMVTYYDAEQRMSVTQRGRHHVIPAVDDDLLYVGSVCTPETCLERGLLHGGPVSTRELVMRLLVSEPLSIGQVADRLNIKRTKASSLIYGIKYSLTEQSKLKLVDFGAGKAERFQLVPA